MEELFQKGLDDFVKNTDFSEFNVEDFDEDVDEDQFPNPFKDLFGKIPEMIMKKI